MRRITLKEKYEETILEAVILNEFNAELMDQATRVFKSLLAINFSGAGLKTLASARDAAIKDVDEVLAGKSNRGLIRRFINLFKQNKNPLIDSLAFCDALNNFFVGLLQYVEARKTGVQNPDDKKLQDIITGRVSAQRTVAGLADRSEKLKTLEELIVNALKPKGQLLKLGKDWRDKYLKNNFKNVAQELMNSSVKNIETVGKQVIDTLKNVDTISQSIIGATNATTKQTSSTTGTQQTTTTQPSGGSSQSEKTTNVGGTPATDKKAEERAFKVADKIYDAISGEFEDKDKDTIKNVIAVLAYNDLIKIDQ